MCTRRVNKLIQMRILIFSDYQILTLAINEKLTACGGKMINEYFIIIVCKNTMILRRYL